MPFRHWLLTDMLPPPALAALNRLPCAPASGGDTRGQRATHNATRTFFAGALRSADRAVEAVASIYQGKPMIRALAACCGADLAGSYLRIEYCQDMAGFWLEPHTDIGAKRFTLLIHLNDPPPGESWGTDLLHADGSLAARAAGRAGSALIFIPSGDSWHGFAPRPITGIRRVLIVNYVGPDWRSRHELAFPDRPIPSVH